MAFWANDFEKQWVEKAVIANPRQPGEGLFAYIERLGKAADLIDVDEVPLPREVQPVKPAGDVTWEDRRVDDEERRAIQQEAQPERETWLPYRDD